MQHWHVRLATLFVASFLALGGCGRQRASVTLAGSTAFQPFAEKLADEFMAERPDLSITVQGGGSAVGIQSALSGAAQIGMADLVTLPADARSLSSVVVARDGIAMVVHPQNTITDLSTEQIRGMFNGQIRDWRDVGGPAGTITLVSREAGSGTRTSFEQIIGGIELTPDAIVQDSNGTIRETVANDPRAVGYLTHGILNEKVKAVRVDGFDCSLETIAAGDYRLVRPVFFLTQGEPAGTAREFIDYVLSPAGQQIIRDNGLIPAR